MVDHIVKGVIEYFGEETGSLSAPQLLDPGG